MEVTVTSIPSVTYSNDNVTEQPSHLVRWWIRHHRHIGLASMAGSAVLICIIAVILLPIIVQHLSNEHEFCANVTDLTINSVNESINGSTLRRTTPNGDTLSTTTQTVLLDPLCSANATWKSEAVTVAGLPTGASSKSLAGLADPRDLIVDTDGGLFIADCANSRVVYWPINGTEGRLIAGINTSSSWINAFKCATSIIAWKYQLYVSDLDNYRILAFPLRRTERSPDGTTIIGRYGAGSALNQINLVYYMAIDRTRQLFYLSDYGNFRLLKLNLTDNSLQLVAGNGFAGSDSNSLNLSFGMAVEETTGALFVADSGNHRIQKFQLNSSHGTTVAGGNGLGANLSQLNSPSNVALDPSGNLYIADRQNHRIIQWLVGAQQGRIIAGTGTAGTSNIQLNTPVQLKFDIHFNLYVVDQTNNRIQRFDLLHNGC